jgi:uncharacterized protein YecE (DUF72 family)
LVSDGPSVQAATPSLESWINNVTAWADDFGRPGLACPIERGAIEFRGGGWMTDNYRAETLALLERLGFAYVVVDEPQGFRSSTPPVVTSTSPLAVIRFHGHNARPTRSRTSAPPRASATFTRKRS